MKIRKSELKLYVRRPYYDNLVGEWFCPECDHTEKHRRKIINHWQKIHQTITQKGVIL